MRNEKAKGREELEIFAEFLEASKIDIDISTISKRNPPEPDIYCVHRTVGPLYFELVEICDSRLARAYSEPIEKIQIYIRT